MIEANQIVCSQHLPNVRKMAMQNGQRADAKVRNYNFSK